MERRVAAVGVAVVSVAAVGVALRLQGLPHLPEGDGSAVQRRAGERRGREVFVDDGSRPQFVSGSPGGLLEDI